MKLLNRKGKEGITPEKLAVIYNRKLVKQLFNDNPLSTKDYRIRLVAIWLVIIWAFAMAITVSMYTGS